MSAAEAPSVPVLDVKGILLQCLINNQLFDAALSAMGYTMMGLALRGNSELVNQKRYFDSAIRGNSSPDALPEIFFATKTIVTITISTLLQRADELVKGLGVAWESLLADPDRAIVWDSVRVSFVPAGGNTYNLILIYAVTAGKHKGKQDGRD